jgi:hypothetical protein
MTIPQIREGQNTTVILHCAGSGQKRTIVKKYIVYEPRPSLLDAVVVDIEYIEPRKRKWEYRTIMPDNFRFVTIEADSQIVYDSRLDVPCDMELWLEAFGKCQARKARIGTR